MFRDAKRPRPAAKPAGKPTLFDVRCANDLRALCRARLWPVSAERGAWAEEFRLLRTRDLHHDKDPAGRVRKVLDFYVERAATDDGQELARLPACRTGREFRRKFAWIEDRMAKEDAPASPEAERIARRLAQLNSWPKGSDKRLPAAVQKSLTNFTAFQDGLKTLIKTLTAAVNKDPNHRDRHLLGAARALFAAYQAPPAEFVSDWFAALAVRLNNWAEWSGNLDGWGFSVTAPAFVREADGLAASYGGRARIKHVLDRLTTGGAR